MVLYISIDLTFQKIINTDVYEPILYIYMSICHTHAYTNIHTPVNTNMMKKMQER